VLVGKQAIAPVLIAALIPVLAVLSIQIPLKDLLLKVLKALA
jgi:hypothetical protein